MRTDRLDASLLPVRPQSGPISKSVFLSLIYPMLNPFLTLTSLP